MQRPDLIGFFHNIFFLAQNKYLTSWLQYTSGSHLQLIVGLDRCPITLTINKLYWSFLRRRLVSGSKEEENRPESDSDGLNRAGMKTPWVITLTLTLIGKFKSSFWVLSVWMIIFCVLVVKTLEGEQLSHLCSSFLQIVPDHIAGTSCTFFATSCVLMTHV